MDDDLPRLVAVEVPALELPAIGANALPLLLLEEEEEEAKVFMFIVFNGAMSIA